MNQTFLTTILLIFTCLSTYAQNLDLDQYDIYIGDTLISKSDFIRNGSNLDSGRSRRIEFKPITNGVKKAYFLNGKLAASGAIQDLKESGYWIYWHPNGNKAREGEFIHGKPAGIHKYWYENGQLRGIGNWKDGVYDGEWEMYSEDGKESVIRIYKDGKQIE